jgi:hypothetical protein
MDGTLLNSHTEPLELVRVDVNPPPPPRLKAGGSGIRKATRRTFNADLFAASAPEMDYHFYNIRSQIDFLAICKE